MTNRIRAWLIKIPCLRQLKHYVQFYLWKVRTWIRFKREGDSIYNPLWLYWINPSRINLCWLKKSVAKMSTNSIDSLVKAEREIETERNEMPIEELGVVMDGSWDLKTFEFCKLDVYRAFREHFIEQKPWNKTDYYARVLSHINSGHTRWQCANRAEFDVRLEKLEWLYENIRKNGYQCQNELKATGGFRDFRSYGVEDEIRVHIGRHGDYLFADGRHRLSIAKILNLKSVPVKISRRHRKWFDFRKEILAYAEAQSSAKVYQPILHPDLSDIPSVHSRRRWELIQPHVQNMTGRVLDIGANWGFFSHCFESIGFECVAVEMMPKDVYFLYKLRRAENRKFKIVKTSILDYSGSLDFTIVLGLNIFHHFLKTESLFHKFSNFLKRLNCEIMFFQPHLVDEPQMQNAYRNYNEKEYVKFIQEKTHLTKAMLLGKDDDGRSLYKLER